MMRLDNFLLEFDAMMMPDKRTDQSPKIEQALTEAWLCLDKEIMLTPRMLTETQYITRRGHEFLEHADLDAYKRPALLWEMPLDPVLARKVRPTYMRGDYDTAVFQAYKRGRN